MKNASDWGMPAFQVPKFFQSVSADTRNVQTAQRIFDIVRAFSELHYNYDEIPIDPYHTKTGIKITVCIVSYPNRQTHLCLTNAYTAVLYM